MTDTEPPRAPELPRGALWINSEEPLSLARLKGKLVLLDFWTSCCVSCLHVLPLLARLEREFADALRVIGVHTAKFPHERDPETVRRAVLRHRIAHPVVCDPGRRIAEPYGVSAWPTLVLVDPEGYVAGQVQGEPDEEELEAVIRETLAAAEARGTLIREVPPPRPAASRGSGLRFPGKLLADLETRTLYIADTGNHRILAANLEGHVREIIGHGEPGFDDGATANATFRDPQGLALLDGRLAVADTGNGAIRRVDLAARTVETLARDLSSPRDVAPLVAGERRLLFVAASGSHQIGLVDLDTMACEAFAGTGEEGLVDGDRAEALFAQPSGLALHRRWLFVADSEASALRCIDLESESDEVSTVIGEGLFVWGDDDGDWEKARLQHPLGVAVCGPTVYVADTFNHRVRAVDLETRGVRTVLDGLCEPGGLSIAGRRLYVADTGSHAVRLLDLDTGDVRSLEFVI